MKRNDVIRFVTYTALMTACTYVGTLLGFSSPQFYFNLGDSVILLTAALFGPIPALIAGGLGSFLADLTVFPATMLFTLVIKAIEGLVAGMLFTLIRAFLRRLAKKYASSESARLDSTIDCASAKPDDKNGSDPSRLEDNMSTQVPDAADGDVEGKPADRSDDPDGMSSDPAQSLANGDKPDTKDLKAARRMTAIKIVLSVLASLFSTGLMVCGYFIAQTFMYGTLASALVALPMDTAQAAVSTTAANVILYLFRLERLAPKLPFRR